MFQQFIKCLKIRSTYSKITYIMLLNTHVVTNTVLKEDYKSFFECRKMIVCVCVCVYVCVCVCVCMRVYAYVRICTQVSSSVL